MEMHIDKKRCPCVCTRTKPRTVFSLWVTVFVEPGSSLPDVFHEQNNNHDGPLLTLSQLPNEKTDLLSLAEASGSRNPSQPDSRVAALPLQRPLPGIEYLGIIEKSPPHIHYDHCWKCESYWPPNWCLWRRRRFDGLQAWYGYRIPAISQAFVCHRESREILFRSSTGISNGEVERTAGAWGSHWTEDFDWALAMQHGDPAGTWVAETRLFFFDLSGEMRGAVPWWDKTCVRRDSLRNTRGYTAGADPISGQLKFKASWGFSDNAEVPYWCAEVTLWQKSIEMALDDEAKTPLDYLTTQTCLRYSLISSLLPRLGCPNYQLFNCISV